MQNIAEGLVVYPKTIAKNLAEELPFMATENIMMQAVEAGGDRQMLHERIRVHSQAAAHEIKAEGKPNDLLARLQADPAFAGIDVAKIAEPSAFVGRAPQQVDAFVADYVEPIRQRYADRASLSAEVTV
jgi:adenylosuccinate lyase